MKPTLSHSRAAFAIIAAALFSGIGATHAVAQETEFIVAVLPFTSPDDGEARDVQEAMIEGLDLLGAYTLIEQDAVNDALDDAGYEPGQEIPEAKTLEIGRELGAKIVARGTLARSGGEQWTAEPVFVEVGTRITQEAPVSANDASDVGAAVVESFNSRNQADKHVIFGRDYARS
jgi:hypothetical protein